MKMIAVAIYPRTGLRVYLANWRAWTLRSSVYLAILTPEI